MRTERGSHLELFASVSSAEEAATRERAAYPLDLDFFETAVRLHVRSELELSQWRYFFKHHLGQRREPAVEVWVAVERVDASFIESIHRKDYSMKSIHVRVDDRFILWSRFDRWSTAPSPLPPFTLPPLRDEVVVLNASAVQVGDGRAVVLAAPPYQGKSTIAGALLRRGGRPLTDNLTVIDVANLQVQPYVTPTGVRAETLGVASWAEPATRVPPDRLTISEVTGPVFLLHFDEIVPHQPAVASEVIAVVHLRNERGTGRAARLVALDGSEGQRLLVGATTPTASPDARETVVSALSTGAAHFRLQYDLLANLDDAVELVRGIFS